MKVREKRAKLKESEAELARRHEATRRALEAQARDLEERQRALNNEKAQWERETGLSLDDLRRRSLEANSKESVLFSLSYLMIRIMKSLGTRNFKVVNRLLS